MRVRPAVEMCSASLKDFFSKKMTKGKGGERPRARCNLLAASVCALAFGVLGLAPGARAQAAAQFSYAQSTIGSGLNLPEGVAVDASGNVYIADFGAGDVLKETLQSGGTYAQSTVVSGLNEPRNVAVDASGNVYITGPSFSDVLKETPGPGGTYTQSTIGSGLNLPGGVAVDASGNVYIAESLVGYVLKETPGSSGYTQSTVASGLNSPGGVAVDASGNVYIADTASSLVLKETLGSGGTYTQSTIVSGLYSPEGVAVDGSGNVYIADTNNNRVVKETLGSGGAYTQSVIVSGLNTPIGVAVDGSGDDVYIGDTVNNRVLEEQTAGVNFHAVAVGSASAAQALTFTFTAAGTIAAPSVVTQGAAGRDFGDAGTGTCDTNGTGHSYSIGDTCTVDVTFASTKAGTRYGAANLVDASGSVIATAYLYGTGQGPQIAFGPGVQSTVVGGLYLPGGVAVDANGNVYIGDIHNNRVLKETLGSGGTYTQSTIGSGLNLPTGVAVDGSGNVYIADSVNNRVLKETLQPGGAYTQSTVGNGLYVPNGVAVDVSGDVYIVDSFNNRMLKETLEPDGTYTQSVIIVSGLNQPDAVAVDASGNVYIADTLNNRVLKETLQSNGSYVQSTIGSGLSQPNGMAVDASGDVYIGDTLNNRVLKETLQPDGSYTQSVFLGSGLYYPEGVAVDGGGNVYIADSDNNRVLKEDIADAPSLTFASTPVGLATSPQTVTIENIGNEPLTIEPPASGENPAISSSFMLDSSLTCPQIDASASPASLAAGASCTLPVDFTPLAAGSLTGTLTITDDTLNALPPTYATQTIQLSGTATQGTTTTSLTSSPDPAYAGNPVTFTATVTGAGVTPTGTVTFNDGSTTLGTVNLGLNGEALLTTSTLAVGAHSITAVYNGDGNYTGSPSAAQSETINPATFSLSMPGSAGTLGIGQTVNLPVTATPQGVLSSPVSLQCKTSNPDVYCSLNPNSLTLGSSPSSVVLYIWPSIGSTAVLPGGPGSWNWPLAGLGLLSALGLLLWLAGRGRISGRVRRLVWTGTLATALGLALAGCSSGKTTPPAAPGSYTVTVTGTSGSQTSTAQTSVTVK